MQTIRIHFQDSTSIDVLFSDSQEEEFRQWLRFANQNEAFSIAGEECEIIRKNIAWTETV